MKRMIKLLFVCFLITGCGSSNYTNIDSNEAMKLLENNNTVIIDVRDSDEYETGHIANSVNIPLNDIANIDYSKDQAIILYCATGVRSLQAIDILSDKGYTNLYNLDGGLLNWGFELEE